MRLIGGAQRYSPLVTGDINHKALVVTHGGFRIPPLPPEGPETEEDLLYWDNGTTQRISNMAQYRTENHNAFFATQWGFRIARWPLDRIRSLVLGDKQSIGCT